MSLILEKWLTTTTIARKVILVDELDSTNNYAKSLLAENKLEHGTVIIAKRQTGGRGQKDHNWESPEGGLYYTCVVNSKTASRITMLTLAAGLACHESVKQLTGLNTRLKWVNDILYNNKKIGGLLLESKIRGESTHLVLGVGLNVNNKTGELSENLHSESTSIIDEYGQQLDLYQLAAVLSNNIEYFLNLYDNHNDKLIKSLWIKNSDTIGRNISFGIDSGRKNGLVLGINEFGALIVQTVEGEMFSLVDNEGIVYQ